MNRPALLSVEQAAARLGLSRVRVQKLVESGDLPASMSAGAWWIDARTVERRRRAQPGRGRPLSGATAWLVLLLASGERESPAWQALLAHDHSRDRAHTWLASHSLADDFPVLRHRARREQLDGHLSEFPLILAHDAVRATGISAAAGLGLTGGRDQAEFYAPLSLRASLVRHHALEPVVDGSVLARWVPDAIWAPLDSMERSPSAAVLVDLLEHDDPRVRREAAAALAR